MTTPTVTKVRIIIGATAAYACIEKANGGSLDVRLDSGKHAARSLRAQADDLDERIARLARQRDTMREAAELLAPTTPELRA
jgi:ABC-type transporter Mla subunit MlaD